MVTSVLAAAAEEAPELPMSPAAFGLGSLAFFGALLAILWAFRSVGRRH